MRMLLKNTRTNFRNTCLKVDFIKDWKVDGAFDRPNGIMKIQNGHRVFGTPSSPHPKGECGPGDNLHEGQASKTLGTGMLIQELLHCRNWELVFDCDGVESTVINTKSPGSILLLD